MEDSYRPRYPLWLRSLAIASAAMMAAGFLMVIGGWGYGSWLFFAGLTIFWIVGTIARRLFGGEAA